MTLRFQYIKKCLTNLRAVEPIHNSIIGLLQRKKEQIGLLRHLYLQRKQ